MVQCMGTPGVALLTNLESLLRADLITESLTVDEEALSEEFTGMYRSTMANIFACSVVDEDARSGQDSVSQAVTGTPVLGFVYNS